jgi:uncharacterized protein (DUF362 family)
MNHPFSRRTLFGMAAGSAILHRAPLTFAQQLQTPAAPVPDFGYAKRATVSLMHGEDRRKNVYEALVAIDDQIRPVLKQKKSVVIKPNNVSTVNQLAATHADALRGMLDYLDGRFKGPVYIAESSAGTTMEGFENFKYNVVANEYKKQKVSLIDLNTEGKYEVVPVLDANLHPTPVRLAARLLDPDAFTLCAACLKTHNVVIATLSVKNMTLGAPLRSAPKTPRSEQFNDKRKYHGGVRQTHYSIMQTAQKMAPFWGATVIDGFDGMEGNGPSSGTPVPSRVAIASTDYIAADRVGVEAMGVNPDWIGCLKFCQMAGIGQYDIAKIDIRGEKIASIKKEYRLHRDIERELRWMGTMEEVPEKLG